MGRGAEAFSTDYATARRRLRALAGDLHHEAHEIGDVGPDGAALTIDLVRAGPVDARRVVVVSSGTHGVEGFFGSAVQIALLERGLDLPADTAVLLIHALNPWGFAHGRRVDAANIDLNRNFLVPGQEYSGADPGYAAFDGLINPKTPPGGFDPFLLRAGWNIARHGMGAMKAALAGGQYDYARGLFFGGEGPSASQRVLAAQLPPWVGGAEHVVHIDLHTGMGPWGTYVLALSEGSDSARARRVREIFGPERVQALDPGAVLYVINGVLADWCVALNPGVMYDGVLAEFGTYPVLKVISALRAENRATHWCPPGDPRIDVARERLREIFAPADSGWRDDVVEKGLGIIDRALEYRGGE